MLSAFSAMPSSDGLFGTPFPAFEGGCSTPWDWQEPLFPFQNDEPTFFSNKQQEPVVSNSGSEKSNPKHVILNSGSDEPNRNMNNPSPGSDDSNRTGPIIDERKRRRMISNRESARRSRMRKQKHLENLRNQANRLKVGKRELMDRLRLVTQLCQLVRRENDLLQTESALLREKLWAMHQVLQVRELQQFSPLAWPCNTITSINPQNPPS